MFYRTEDGQPIDWDFAEISVLLGAGAVDFGKPEIGSPWALFENNYSIWRARGHYWLSNARGEVLAMSKHQTRKALVRLAKLARKGGKKAAQG